jgi:hypothetical protein
MCTEANELCKFKVGVDMKESFENEIDFDTTVRMAKNRDLFKHFVEYNAHTDMEVDKPEGDRPPTPADQTQSTSDKQNPLQRQLFPSDRASPLLPQDASILAYGGPVIVANPRESQKPHAHFASTLPTRSESTASSLATLSNSFLRSVKANVSVGAIGRAFRGRLLSSNNTEQVEAFSRAASMGDLRDADAQTTSLALLLSQPAMDVVTYVNALRFLLGKVVGKLTLERQISSFEQAFNALKIIH